MSDDLRPHHATALSPFEVELIPYAIERRGGKYSRAELFAVIVTMATRAGYILPGMLYPSPENEEDPLKYVERLDSYRSSLRMAKRL
jgi:hypothetical protein